MTLLSSQTQDAYRYDYAPNLDKDSTASKLLHLVGTNKRVLELGCATGSMTRLLTEQLGCQVTGIELDPLSAERARPYCEKLFIGNLDQFDWSLLGENNTFDVILIADVLEHLRQPMSCLKQLHAYLAQDGYVLVSVPNIAYNGIIASLLCDDFPYADVGLLDRTHIHFFTWKTLEQTLHAAGFSIVIYDAVTTPNEHPEFYAYWQQLPESIQAFLNHHAHGHVYQYIVKIVKDDRPRTFAVPPETCNWMAHFEKQQATIQALKAELQTVYQSRSWKLTTPLRHITKLLQTLKSILFHR